MAKKKILLLIIAFQLIVSIVLSAVIIVLVKRHDNDGGEAVSLGNNSMLGLNEDNLTLTEIRLYWHDILSGSNPSAIRILPPVSGASTSFGQINMIDDPMTEGPDLSSKLVARAQGFYALASQEEVGMLMAMNFVFVDGEYNGSTITVLGRNTIMSDVREMPVIGGSGVFRLARGYVEARTNKVSFNSGDAVVEYNVHVLHY